MKYDIQSWHKSTWFTPTRYYNIEIKQTLFGEWVCCRSWGGRKNKRGSELVNYAVSLDDAIRIKNDVIALREKRGYVEYVAA